MWWAIGGAAWTALVATFVHWWSRRDRRALLRRLTREYRDSAKREERDL